MHRPEARPVNNGKMGSRVRRSRKMQRDASCQKKCLTTPPQVSDNSCRKANSSVRAAVVLTTTFATALHLAIGCCGHMSHFDAGYPCCVTDLVCGQAVECCEDHDHDYGHESENTVDGFNVIGPTSPGGMIGAPATGHDCDGCRCVATSESHHIFDAAPIVICFVASAETESIASMQATLGPCWAWDPPVSSVLRPPLFERLVV